MIYPNIPTFKQLFFIPTGQVSKYIICLSCLFSSFFQRYIYEKMVKSNDKMEEILIPNNMNLSNIT